MARRPDALVHNSVDQEQLDDATRVIVERGHIEKLDMRKVLGTVEGRREFMRRQSRCGILRTSFSGEAALTMAFNEGERNIGLWEQVRAIELAPELYLIALHEAQQEKR